MVEHYNRHATARCYYNAESHHSSDILKVFHGSTEPTFICGYHEQRFGIPSGYCIACDTGECGPLIRVLEDGDHYHGNEAEGYCTHELEGPDADDGSCGGCGALYPEYADTGDLQHGREEDCRAARIK